MTEREIDMEVAQFLEQVLVNSCKEPADAIAILIFLFAKIDAQHRNPEEPQEAAIKLFSENFKRIQAKLRLMAN